MKNIIIIILISVILLLLLDCENFVPVAIPKSFTPNDYNTRVYFNEPTVTTTSIYQNRFNLVPATMNTNQVNISEFYVPNGSSNPVNTSSNSVNGSSNPVTIDKRLFDLKGVDNTLFVDDLTSNKCCLVEKKLFANNITIDNTKNKYNYTPYYGDSCNLDNFDLNENRQLFFDGVNGWDNSKCSEDKGTLGSCQHYDLECIDFVPENNCKDYNNKMPPDRQNRTNIEFTWNPKPCFTIIN